MYFEQFYLSCLAHASYMIGSASVAAVVDPQRDVELYIDEARKNDLRIGHMIETQLVRCAGLSPGQPRALVGRQPGRSRAGRDDAGI